jgi:hypothetical protein
MAQQEQQHGERLRWSCLDEIWQPTYSQFVWTEMAQLQSQGVRDGLRWTARILDANKGMNINTKAVRPQQLDYRTPRRYACRLLLLLTGSYNQLLGECEREHLQAPGQQLASPLRNNFSELL